MKNIFLLPTDKPSMLYTNNGELHLDNWIANSNGITINQNIYITSNEKFKQDEYITDGVEVIKASPKLVNAQGLVNRRNWRKVILTTDQDLIKDGVQAIDDEFLEWYVKNPTCEFVEVGEQNEPCLNCEWDHDSCPNVNDCLKTTYKIIIPEKEQTKCYCGHTTYCDCGPEEPKQETLEEAFKRIRYELDYTEFDFASFGLGAKWQEQSMYSEEDMREAFEKGEQQEVKCIANGLDKKCYCTNEIHCQHKKLVGFEEWFEQFKKK